MGARDEKAARPPIRLQRQPDGISCGPTCLSMIQTGLREALGRKARLGVEHIAAMCGTNHLTGTTHEGVDVALRGLGIAHGRHLGRERAMGALSEALDAGDYALCRTLTHGAKHWAVAAWPASGGRIHVFDPWLGEHDLTPAALEDRLRPRDYEVWRIPSRQAIPDVAVGPLLEGGMAAGEAEAAVARALDLAEMAFADKMDEDVRAYTRGVTDWSLSRALRVDGRIVGVYLLNGGPIAREVPDGAAAAFAGMDGVEGVALMVDPACRGMGYGRLLRDQPRLLGYDFVWGQQMKTLGNLDHWLKRRRLVHDGGECWVTAQVFGPSYRLDPGSPGPAFGR